MKLKTIFGIFICLLVFCTMSVYAQGNNNIWYFGTNAGVDFNNLDGNSNPTALSNGQTTVGCPHNNLEGPATISDAIGNLQFYAAVSTFWDASHTPMPNANATINGKATFTQSYLIVPDPYNSDRYYVFHIDQNINGGCTGTNGLFYSIVDMTLPGNGTAAAPLGDVDNSFKNVQLLNSTPSERLTAAIHDNGTDVWIVTYNNANKTFHAFLLDNNGVNTPAVTTVLGDGSSWGSLKASSDGRMLAMASASARRIELFDFDNGHGGSSGSVTSRTLNHQFDGTHGYTYSSEFSPDNKRLYVGVSAWPDNPPNYGIFQFDLTASPPTMQKIANQSIGAIELGPNGRIYFGSGASTLGAIENPNASAASVIVDLNAVALAGGTSNAGGLQNAFNNLNIPKADLIVESITVKNGDCGNKPSLEAKIKNQGAINAVGTFKVGFYDGEPGNGGTLIENKKNVTDLNAGDTKTVTLTLSTDSFQSGENVWAWVDTENNIEEGGNENNNKFDSGYKVTLPMPIFYALDYRAENDNHLVRYDLRLDKSTDLGVIHWSDDSPVSDMNSLGYIPGADFVYSIWNAGYLTSLLKIDLKTAEASTVQTCRRFYGIASYEENSIYHSYGIEGWQFDEDDHWLSEIYLEGSTPDLWTSPKNYEGLAINDEGTWYGASDEGSNPSKLYIITEGADNLVGQIQSSPQVEGLEFMTNLCGVNLEALGIDPGQTSWYEHGILFGYGEGDDKLVVINPTNGNTLPQDLDLGMSTVKVRGLVFLDEKDDPNIADPVKGIAIGYIEPKGARDAGAKWKLTKTGYDSGWKDHCAIIRDLTPGSSYKIEFKDVAGWTTPTDIDVTVAAGDVASGLGTYTSDTGCDPIDFDDYTVSSYGGDADGTFEKQDDGFTLYLSGNGWKKIMYSYSVTTNTVIEFDFKSTIEAEIQAIGLDEDNDNDNAKRCFKVYGTQNWNKVYPPDANFDEYDGSGGWVHYSIPVGEYYTGSMTVLAFVNDHDGGAKNGTSWWKNVKVCEGGAPTEPDITLTPASWNYGNVEVGSSSNKVFEIKNDGNADLSITGLSITTGGADYALVSPPSTPFTLTPGSTQNVTVKFEPSSEGSKSGNFRITSDDPDEGTVNVSLTGTGTTGGGCDYDEDFAGGAGGWPTNSYWSVDSEKYKGSIASGGSYAQGPSDATMSAVSTFTFKWKPVSGNNTQVYFNRVGYSKWGRLTLQPSSNRYSLAEKSGGSVKGKYTQAYTFNYSTEYEIKIDVLSDKSVRIYIGVDEPHSAASFDEVAEGNVWFYVNASTSLFDDLCIDNGGAAADPHHEEQLQLPETTALLGNYPNPFNPETIIAYQLKQEEQVTITVYDLMGRRIKTLIDGVEPAGSSFVVWHGTNEAGVKVASGMYIYRMQAGSYGASKKMFLLK